MTYLTDRPIPFDPRADAVRAEPADVQGWNARVRAHMYTGDAARQIAELILAAPPTVLAYDTETMGLDVDSLRIKCATFAAFGGTGEVHTWLLDPRRADDYALIRRLTAHAATLVLHNAAFDVPSMYQNGLIDLDSIRKVDDTLVDARLSWPDKTVPKSLEALAGRDDVLALDAGGETVSTAFAAAGYRSTEGFAMLDVWSPVYCLGAMADTVVTLRAHEPLKAAVRARLCNNPFESATTCKTDADADRIRDREQTTNRVMLRRSAKGVKVDVDYLDAFTDKHDEARRADEKIVAELVGDEHVRNAARVVVRIDELGELPSDWPRTKTGRPSSKADDVEKLTHPAALAVVRLKQLDKVTNYLTTCRDYAALTGRVHPQVGVLKAVSGRMSYSSPALQQFSADARPILVPDDDQRATGGWTSIDWSSIEPVVMGNCARDERFITPFNEGHDLYIPTAKVAGLIPADMPEQQVKQWEPDGKGGYDEHPGRKAAKTVMLAAMYGQGRQLLADNLTKKLKRPVSVDEAGQVQASLKTAMPDTFSFMASIQKFAEDVGLTMTADGRVIPIPRDPESRQFKGYVGVNYFCVTSDTTILTSDLRHVGADSVKVGDTLVGFDEYTLDRGKGKGSGKRRYRVATVTETRTLTKPSVTVKTSDGKSTTCSSDHMWLVRRPDQTPRFQWVRSDELRVGVDQFMSLGVWQASDTRDAGYLAGLYDGEGCLVKRQSSGIRYNLIFSQRPGDVMARYREAMAAEGLPYNFVEPHQSNTSPCAHARTSGMSKIMRILGTLRPARFMPYVHEVYVGGEVGKATSFEGTPTVVAVDDAGEREVVSITTDTHTLVANGYLSHNCQGSAYSVLSDAINRIDAAGLGDSIELAIHDELVVDAEAAHDVQAIMTEPPAWLTEFAERKPLFRTDANALPDGWRYV